MGVCIGVPLFWETTIWGPGKDSGSTCRLICCWVWVAMLKGLAMGKGCNGRDFLINMLGKVLGRYLPIKVSEQGYVATCMTRA